MSKGILNMIFLLEEKVRNVFVNPNLKVSYFCRSCSSEISEKFIRCPYCGFLGRDIQMGISDTVFVRDQSFRARVKRKGVSKFVYELLRRYKNSGDKRLPEGVYEDREISKDKNLYKQVVYKVKNRKISKILHKEMEKLSEHK